MKIIDAHLHLFTEDSAEEMARQVGHHGTVRHLREVYGELDIVHGVVMGNYGLDVQGRYPADLFHYCVGLDSGTAARRNRRSRICRTGWRSTCGGTTAAV